MVLVGWWSRVQVAIGLGAVLAGCGVPNITVPREPGSVGTGVYHQVRRGENLYRIGKAYGVSYQKLARANRLKDPDAVEVGQRIFVPGGERHLPVEIITPKRATVEAPDDGEFPRAASIFIWPLTSGTLTSSFGPRGHSFHDGIDIGAPPGTPVRAARDGTVIYSDTLRGYGNVVIIGHAGNYATVYAHNEENLVGVGARIRQGQLVARVGRTGRTSGSNLHFEIRKDNVARNPVYFLPRQTAQRTNDGPT